VKKVIFLGAVVLIAIFLIRTLPAEEKGVVNKIPPTPTATSIEFSEYTAAFEIYTNGTRRIFTDQKYHNKSDSAYITLPKTSVINIKKPLVTWSDFFETLPMKLTKDCLTTGTGQTFCTGNGKVLRFYINNLESPNALDEVIKKDSLFVVRYQ